MFATVVFAGLDFHSLLIPALAIGVAIAAITAFFALMGFGARPALALDGLPSPSVVQFRKLPVPFAPPGQGDKRRSLRRNGKPMPVLLRRGGNADRLEVAWVLNRSCGGLGLVYKNPLP